MKRQCMVCGNWFDLPAGKRSRRKTCSKACYDITRGHCNSAAVKALEAGVPGARQVLLFTEAEAEAPERITEIERRRQEHIEQMRARERGLVFEEAGGRVRVKVIREDLSEYPH